MATTRALAPRRRPGAIAPDPISAFAAYGLYQFLQKVRMPGPLPSPAQWIRLDEAAAFSGLSVVLLKRLIAAGKLKWIRDGAVKVRRGDLANIDHLAVMAETQQKLKQTAAELRKRKRA